MVQAMKTAHGYMLGRTESSPRFRASVDSSNGWLRVDCPGDACQIYPSHGDDIKEGRGYEFACHNVDTPAQQLTLLAGLAALHDRVRKELTAL